MSSCKSNYCVIDLKPIRDLYKKHKSFFDSLEKPRAYNMVKSVFDEN